MKIIEVFMGRKETALYVHLQGGGNLSLFSKQYNLTEKQAVRIKASMEQTLAYARRMEADGFIVELWFKNRLGDYEPID